MDIFKRTNAVMATSWDWNCPRIVKRFKGDGNKLRRLARRRLKQELRKELKENGI